MNQSEKITKLLTIWDNDLEYQKTLIEDDITQEMGVMSEDMENQGDATVSTGRYLINEDAVDEEILRVAKKNQEKNFSKFKKDYETEIKEALKPSDFKKLDYKQFVVLVSEIYKKGRNND